VNGREADYNDWYDKTHIPDLLAIPGVASAQRYAASPTSLNSPPSAYLAIYEIEADDPATVMQELMRRGASGEMSRTDAIDPASANLWLWAARELQ
jgi:hypothetical protein